MMKIWLSLLALFIFGIRQKALTDADIPLQLSFVVKTGDSNLTFMTVLEPTARNVTAGEFSELLRLKMEYL